MASDSVTILVGTTKGAFLIAGGSDRSGWDNKGPLCEGWPINHLLGTLKPARFGLAAVVIGMARGYGGRTMAVGTGKLPG